MDSTLTTMSHASNPRIIDDTRQKTVRLRVPLRAAAAKRSVKNILEWNEYLPSACVRTMVRMGWDLST